jgi:hypothetical protein
MHVTKGKIPSVGFLAGDSWRSLYVETRQGPSACILRAWPEPFHQLSARRRGSNLQGFTCPTCWRTVEEMANRKPTNPCLHGAPASASFPTHFLQVSGVWQQFLPPRRLPSSVTFSCPFASQVDGNGRCVDTRRAKLSLCSVVRVEGRRKPSPKPAVSEARRLPAIVRLRKKPADVAPFWPPARPFPQLDFHTEFYREVANEGRISCVLGFCGLFFLVIS